MNAAGWIRFLLPALLMAGCTASMPPIRPDAAVAPCTAPFVHGVWQLTHTVRFSVAGATRGALLGVTRVDAPAAAIHCALMTVEGMVVFEARDDGGLEVIRALPPFTDDAWARGLMDDVRLSFLPPQGRLAATGRTADGAAVCRIMQTGGAVVDVIGTADAGWIIRRYGTDHHLEKEIVAEAGAPEIPAVARRMILTDHGLPGYTITMDLIDAQPVTG